jgi:hypothetical protein
VDNQRSNYRHYFARDDRLRVELSVAGGSRVVSGQIVNMSLGGIAVDLGDASFRLDPAEPVAAHFAIPHGLRQFALPAEVVHVEQTARGDRVGLQFLPPKDPDALEERERALWAFLLDEQRREIWQRRRKQGT